MKKPQAKSKPKEARAGYGVLARAKDGIVLSLSAKGRINFYRPKEKELNTAGKLIKWLDRIAKRLFLDRKYYGQICRAARSGVNHDYWTLNNSLKWLYLALNLNKRQDKKSRASIAREMAVYFNESQVGFRES